MGTKTTMRSETDEANFTRKNQANFERAFARIWQRRHINDDYEEYEKIYKEMKSNKTVVYFPDRTLVVCVRFFNEKLERWFFNNFESELADMPPCHELKWKTAEKEQNGTRTSFDFFKHVANIFIAVGVAPIIKVMDDYPFSFRCEEFEIIVAPRVEV